MTAPTAPQGDDKLTVEQIFDAIDTGYLTLAEAELEVRSRISEAAEYQTGIRLCSEKLGIWGLSVAKEGRQVYGEIYKSEQEAKDAIPSVLAELRAAEKQS